MSLGIAQRLVNNIKMRIINGRNEYVTRVVEYSSSNCCAYIYEGVVINYFCKRGTQHNKSLELVCELVGGLELV